VVVIDPSSDWERNVGAGGGRHWRVAPQQVDGDGEGQTAGADNHGGRREVEQQQRGGYAQNSFGPARRAAQPAGRDDRQRDDRERTRGAGRENLGHGAARQQRLAVVGQDERDGHEEGRQRVLERLHHRPQRVATGDGGGRDCGECGRRAHLREHRVIEDEHVDGGVGHAEALERRADDDRGDDERRGDRHG
jgi:hypothetical protein